MAHPHASETQPNGPIPTRPDDLTIGMYVDLNCSWFRHPFASKTFTITSDKELTIIRGLGLDTVLVHPARSDSQGAPQNSHNDGDGRTTAAPTLPDTTGPDTVRCDTPAPPQQSSNIKRAFSKPTCCIGRPSLKAHKRSTISRTDLNPVWLRQSR
ncbi:MAG: DUF3391 domain-containing protein [Nitrospira sp.]|nr:DUF3391 domain-containing protein [Nitrospira sp.]